MYGYVQTGHNAAHVGIINIIIVKKTGVQFFRSFFN